MDTDSHTASPQPIALQDGGETVQLVSPEQKSLVDFDATNNNADQSAVLLSLEKKSTIEAYKGRWESLIQRTEKDMGEGLNKECLSKCALSLDDSTEQNSVDSRRGRGRLHSMEHDQPAMFAKLGTDLENEGIVSDLLGFVREKELYKSVGKAWKRGYLLYDPPRTDRSSLMAYMELTNVLVSTRNRSLIAIKDFDQWIEMLPNLKIELTLSGLLKILSGLLSSCGNEQIIVFTINHNHMDRVDAALLRPLSIDLYIHSSSHLPSALRNDGGEIVQFDSSEQQSSVDFDTINNKAYQRDVCMSNSVEKNTIEASRRQCMHENVLSLVDSTISLLSTDSVAPDNSAHHLRAYQSGRILFNSKNKDTEEGLNRECLTKSALNLDDSSKQKSLMDVDATENKAYQSCPVVSLSDNKNRGQALKRECITKIIRGLEDLQHHSGGRPDDSANSFGAIYDSGIHTTRSLAQNSFKVLEALPTQKQPNDCVPLLSLGRLELEGCVQEEKSQDLPRHILVLNPLEQSTKNVAHVARADQWSPTLPLPEKKMVRTWKRKYRIMSVIFEIHQQHFGRRCEGAVKSFRATLICRKSGINRASRVKRIHKRCGIHQWPFHQKWATRKGYSSGDEKPFEISSLSMDEKLDSWLLFIQMSKFARSSPQTLALPDGGEIVEPKASPSNSLARKPFEECQESRSTKLNSLSQKSFEVLHVLPLWEQSNNIRHLVQWRRLVLKRWVILKKSQDLPRTLQIMNCSGSLTAQSASSFHWPISLPDGGRIVPLLEKKIMRKPFKRKYSTISVSFEDHHQHFSSRCGCAANGHGAKRICEQRGFTLVSTVKRIRRQYGIHWCTFRQGYSFGGEGPAGVLSPSMEERVISRFQFLHISWLARSSPHPLALRSGRKISGHIAFLSSEFPATNNGAPPGRQGQCGSSASRPEKERVRETTNREGTGSHTINREVLEQHFGKKREDGAKILGISVSTLKRIRKKHGISMWSYWRRNKGNSSPSSQGVPPWPDWRSNHVFIPPDPNGEKNPSPMVNTLSPNGHIRREKEMGGPKSEPNEYLPASFEDPNFQNTGNGSIAEFENPSSIHDSHDVHCSYADFHSSAVNNENEAAGGSGYFWGQVSELSNFTFPVHSDSAAPIQPVPTIPHTMAHPHIESTQILRENMGSFEDRTNLLAPQMEPLPEGHVFGSVICTIGSVSDLAPSQPMPSIPHTMESSEYWRDMLALVEGHLMEKNHYGSFNLMEPSCSNLAPSEPMPTIPHTTTLPTERQDLRFVKLDATYGEDPINLYLPLMPGIMELKQAVSKQLGLGLDSFKVTYENERGKRILMTHDEDVRELLRLASSENQDSN